MNTTETLDLRPGDWVEVRDASEILASLDLRAAFDGLPFMPEMLPYCGHRYQVYKRADKTCDPVSATFMRRMENTVHLSMVRCDGSSHGGCHAGCMLFWKEAWLRRVESPTSPPPAADNGGLSGGNGHSSNGNGHDSPKRDRAWLESMVYRDQPNGGETCYRCQATDLNKATNPLPWWNASQYVRDVCSNDVPVTSVVQGIAVSAFNKIWSRLTGRSFPNVAGSLKRTPSERLDLQPGDWVTVKSKEEILLTLDAHGRNRGMTFESTMLPYCGKRFRVLRRVDQIINETTGQLKKMSEPSIILETVICSSIYRRACPRAHYLYWREIWLRRCDPADAQRDETQAPMVLPCLVGSPQT